MLLGAAPRVGKTYTMLEEGARLRDEGRDVVVAGRRSTDITWSVSDCDELFATSSRM